MKAGLLERIQTRGYWRFLFHPVEFEERRLKRTAECYKAVQRNNVTLRGWDYPHVEPQSRGDGRGLAEIIDDGYESWTDWADAIEFWRYYRSGQFLHYRVLKEDWQDEHDKVFLGFSEQLAKSMGASYNKPTARGNSFLENPHLEVVGVIYEITEVFEFWRRMMSDLSEVYESGLCASVELHNLNKRQLYNSDFRMRGSLGQRSTLPRIVVPTTLSSKDVVLDTVNVTLDVIMDIFDRFAYSPSEESVRAEIENYLAGANR